MCLTAALREARLTPTARTHVHLYRADDGAWAEKCGFKGCRGCGECAGLLLGDAEEAEGCRSWCDGDRRGWEGVCSYHGCSSCDQCAPGFGI